MVANPLYGQPGQPYGLHSWLRPDLFQLADMPGAAAPPAAAAPPPVNPMNTETWQSGPAQQLAAYAGMGGGEGSGGNPGGPNFTGIATNPDGSPSRAGNTGLGGGGNDPYNYDSNYGSILGTLGTIGGLAAGVPMMGTLGGLLGGQIDRNNFSNILSAAGLTGMGSLGQSILGSLTSLPGIGSVLGTSNRQQFEDSRRTGLANGVIARNTDPALTGWMNGVPTAAQANAQVDATLGSIANTGYTNDPSYQAGSRGLDPSIGLQAAYAAAQQAAASAIQGGYDPGAGGGNGAAPGGGGGFSGYGFGPDPFGAGMAQSTYSPGWGPNDAFSPGDNAFSGMAKGGTVPRRLGLLDPPGPDDQVAGLQSGEFVVKKAAAMRHRGLLDAINRGASTKQLKGLLG